jgi:hypothetical protein
MVCTDGGRNLEMAKGKDVLTTGDNNRGLAFKAKGEYDWAISDYNKTSLSTKKSYERVFVQEL